MAGKPISVETANNMIDQYIAHVQTLQVPANKKTQYVTFTLSELMSWLTKVAPYTDELKVCMGVHPQTASDPGRLTVIIWPYKSGQPAITPYGEGKDGGGGGGVDPYNDGNSGP